MKSELEAVGLVALLLVVTFALGIELGGSGLAGPYGGLGPPEAATNKSPPIPPPSFVLKAKGINPSDLYASGFYSVVPADMMVPLVGLQATLVSASRDVTHFGRLPSILMTTNSSGVASAILPEGDYEVDISEANFAASTVVTLTDNTTSTLNFVLSPSARAVSALKVVSQDSTGLEPSSRLYALLNYTTAPSKGFAELVGYEPLSANSPSTTVVTHFNPQNFTFPYIRNGMSIYFGTPISLNVTLFGAYQGTQGYWAILAPLGTFVAYPSSSVTLFQFAPILEVSYTAG